MGYIVPQPVKIDNADSIVFKSCFSDEECQKIIDLHKTIPKKEAEVGVGEQGIVDKKKRISDVYWISWIPDFNWIFERLSMQITSGNNKWFQFHLSAMNEALQLTHYEGAKTSGGFYNYHSDHAFNQGFCHRKLSGSLLLNDDFEGGDFEFFNTGKLQDFTKGTLMLFPSFLVHRVLPVTKGHRWSLVFWVSGPLWC